MPPVIRSLATANPPLYMSREDAFAFFDAAYDLAPEERQLYRRVLLEGPIRGRYVGLNSYDEATEVDQDRLLARFLEFGCRTAAQAARQALAQADCAAAEIDALVVNTCTGYLCPGLSSYVAEALELAPTIKTFDLTGMGCGAAIPNLECGAGLLAGGSARKVLCIAVEICSATIFMGPDPGLIVSNSIFGDGAAALVLTSDELGSDTGLPRLLDFESGLWPAHREDLRYQSVGGRLRNVLGRRVPVIGARMVAELAHRLLAKNSLELADIDWWVVHAGGTAVLDQVQGALALRREQLRFSREILAEYGNMSSPTVLFVLRRILDQGGPRPGDRGMLLSFGAGFTGFGALFEFGGGEGA